MPPKGAKKKPVHVLPEKFNPGFVVKDLYKTYWTLGTPIGQGGFGLIYLAAKGENINVNNQNADYVIKIEPKDNGPLFCELHFYTNCGKENDLKQFMQSYKLKHLGVPRFIASGICEYKNNKEYRFLVMDKYFKDLQTIFVEYNYKLNENVVLYLTRQILYSLEYIHSKGYSHADIKGANLMLKTDKQVYLVDYGLAYRFSREGKHQNYIQKPEAKHNGTIEYTSRDAHDGVPPSRRGDIEILLYCIIHWLTGKLPWINVLDNKEEVHKLKIKNLKAPKDFIKSCFHESNISEKVKTFVEYLINEVNSLQYADEPNYLTIQTKINDTLKSCGYTIEENFSTLLNPSSGSKKKNLQSSTNVSKSKVNDFDEIEESSNDVESSTKRSRKLAPDIVIDSPKFKTNRTESPVIKRSKLVEESSIIKSSRLLNRKDTTSETSKGYDFENIELKQTLNIPTLQALNGNDEHKTVTRSSPRLMKPKPLTNNTPQKLRQTNGINYNESENYNENQNEYADEIKKIRTPINVKTPIKRILQTDTAKTPSASPLTRAKLTNQINEKVSSPLALNNLEDEKKVLIVKRRRNVPKTTISTQTYASYLSKLN